MPVPRRRGTDEERVDLRRPPHHQTKISPPGWVMENASYMGSSVKSDGPAPGEPQQQGQPIVGGVLDSPAHEGDEVGRRYGGHLDDHPTSRLESPLDGALAGDEQVGTEQETDLVDEYSTPMRPAPTRFSVGRSVGIPYISAPQRAS